MKYQAPGVAVYNLCFMFFIVSNLGLGSLSKYHGDCQNHEVLDNIDDNDDDDDDDDDGDHIRRCVMGVQRNCFGRRGRRRWSQLLLLTAPSSS